MLEIFIFTTTAILFFIVLFITLLEVDKLKKQIGKLKVKMKEVSGNS